MTAIDARGLSCPIPVARTKQAMEKNPSDEITVLVDSNVAKENVTRLATSKKYSVDVQAVSNDEYKLVLKPSK
ncbi:MAG TPA: sulfurtransferase TusA family protein [Smithellaceae bacterium]|nr:sulfurtransferase TusA family protein [Smithellaceae bacterium]HOZ62548.1 sulfurtransferase TusA family protein [Smithellaceae bacterium]HPV52182.1 sulfurtransferase TusA family protein [Smithella sp.]